MVSAVIAAAGSGTRMGAGMNKIFVKICGKTVIEHTINALCRSMADEIIIAAAAEEKKDIEDIAFKTASSVPITVIEGGASRQQSVFNAVKTAKGDIVCIHDGARCLITPELADRVINDCIKHGAAALGVPCKDTMKLTDGNGFIAATVDRDRLYMIQTPQVFKRDVLLHCHERAQAEEINVTDDCSLFEIYKYKVYISEGSYENIKLTTPEDIITAERILNQRGKNKPGE